MTYDEAKKRAVTYIDEHQSEIVAFLSEYIQHRSVNPDLQNTDELVECQKWLAGQLRNKADLDVSDFWVEDNKYANVAVIFKGSSNGRPIMFAGHTDTVPVTTDQSKAWCQDRGPFSGAIKDGKIWGRGATDMKAGNIAAAMAAVALQRTGIKLAGDLILTFAASEESGNRSVGIDSMIKRGYWAPACIVMEPSNLEVIPVINGEFYFRLKVTGKSGHIASRHQAIYPTSYDVELPGVNAIEKMYKYLQAFWDAERQWGLYQKHPLMEPGTMTLNISKIKGGETFSALAETCEVIGSVLYNPSLSRDGSIGEFKAIIERITESDYWLRKHPPELELPYFLSDKSPIDLSPEHRLCTTLAKAFETVCGFATKFTGSVSTSDGNYISEHEIDVITFGPGRFNMGTHGVNEYIPVKDLIDCTKIYAVALIDWCGLAS